ncbi:hypothetical protein GDO81_003923 [Engystomops pustulosus]|uniref:Uncharacterized protein n=1 Tax=Engystomops pustulosus TaxID=76066 RepID=A0AAV7A5Y3_ENGPU|nr:hypothetical protein GDO81_003923 [Engystomops pustulosus]
MDIHLRRLSLFPTLYPGGRSDVTWKIQDHHHRYKTEDSLGWTSEGVILPPPYILPGTQCGSAIFIFYFFPGKPTLLNTQG